MTITIEDFGKMDLRIGEIISVQDVPNADKLYKLEVDIGGRQIQLVAGIKTSYSKEDLTGKKIVVVANLQPAIIKGITSEGMLLAAVSDNKISLLTVDKDVPVGTEVS